MRPSKTRRIARALVALVCLALVAGIVGIGAVAVVITGRALPVTSGTVRIAGLHAPVTVVRDAAGISQVYADDPHDLFLAQGYVHAQDRLWQMEVWRHATAGRLSELFGESQVKSDRFIRTMGWRIAAQRDLDASSAEVRADLQAYADGVNAYLADHRGRLGLPFVVTGLRAGSGDLGGYEPEPWTPLDSASWQKLQAFSLGGNYSNEIFRVLADAQLGDPALTDGLDAPYPSDHPVVTASDASTATTAPGLVVGTGAGSATATATGGTGARPVANAASTTMAGPADLAGPRGDASLAAWRDLASLGDSVLRTVGLDAAEGLGGDHGIGSNDWVVAPSKSATGHALLANDPHLGIGMPSVWYMNGLHCRTVSPACPFDVVGVSFPGAPFVILGHNARIAWGMTNVGPDVQDLFAEVVDPNDPTRYMTEHGSEPFATREETIRVAGGGSYTLTVRSTRHGPILNDVEPQLAGASTLYALQWTATAAPDTTLQAILGVDRATDWDTFRTALRSYVAPSQNFVYADVDGHIGYQVPGWIPIRAQKADLGARPVPGWDGTHEWVGRIAFDDLPHLFDPPSGIIVTANNAVVDAAYPWFISQEWDPGYRARRITDVLTADAAAGGVTPGAMRLLQMDTTILRAPPVARYLATATASGRVAPATTDGRAVLDAIRGWDDRCDLDSRGCSAFMTFEYRLLRGVFDDDLGPLARDYVGSQGTWPVLAGLLDRPTDRLWDDRTTAGRVETAPDVVTAALDAAGADLRTALGAPGRWAWGRLHAATFREQTLGSSGIGPLEWYFDQGPIPVAGASGAVDNTYYQFSSGYADPWDPTTIAATDIRKVFEVTNLPSYRLTIDLGDLDGARIVQTTGQSGNPFDRHYGDLVGAWANGTTVPLPFSRAAVDGSAAARLTLAP